MKHTLRLALGTALLLMLAACHAPTASHGESGQAGASMELKIHAVPTEQTANLGQTLGKALGKQASVTVAAPGQLLVYAPRDAQASIGTAIASLGKSVASGTGAVQVGIHFWIVDAMAGPGSDDPALKALAPSFESLRQTMGPLHFHLNQITSATASVGSDGFITTAAGSEYPRSFTFAPRAINGDNIVLWISYEDRSSTALAELKTEIDAKMGHYVVLAQAPGACPPAQLGKDALPCPDKPALRLLIVRIDRLNPPA